MSKYCCNMWVYKRDLENPKLKYEFHLKLALAIVNKMSMEDLEKLFQVKQEQTTPSQVELQSLLII